MPIPNLYKPGEHGVKSVGELSRLGPNGTTNLSAATSTAVVIDNRTKEEIKDAEKNAKDEKRVGNYIKPTRYASPPKKKGGKTRKHRGSRKNKKSRRR